MNTAATPLTWADLYQREPALCDRYAANCRSFAARIDRPWYDRWLPNFVDFQCSTRRVAERHGLSETEVRRTAARHLRAKG